MPGAKGPGGEFALGDATNPLLEPGSYDVVLSRHVLWAMPDPTRAFTRWVDLLAPSTGRAKKRRRAYAPSTGGPKSGSLGQG